VQSFLTWRVADPLKFYKTFGGTGDSTRSHYQAAENILKGKLRTAAAAVSSFNASDLLSATEKGSKIRDLETAMLDALKGTRVGDVALSEYGIEPVGVGIASLGLPQQTTASVFQRMKSAREKIANQASSEGRSEAAKIRSGAEADAQKIGAFADQLAKSIRAQGEVEAVEYLKQMREDPQLAVFIQNMDFIRAGFGKTLTLVIPSNMPGFEFFRPDTASRFKGGTIPSSAPGQPAPTAPGAKP
jgi:membrane protease subunit HflC